MTQRCLSSIIIMAAATSVTNTAALAAAADDDDLGGFASLDGLCFVCLCCLKLLFGFTNILQLAVSLMCFTFSRFLFDLAAGRCTE